MDKLKGKKIAWSTTTAPTARNHSAAEGARAKARLQLIELPVTPPGVEQKATWLQIRQKARLRVLWGWGVMNSTALKEAQATGYPRDKMYGCGGPAPRPT
jgi:branched-chain amino acid transport system substrate-binding protein